MSELNKNKYNKEYYENYAKLTLVQLYNRAWETLTLEKESPDLQCQQLGIGIEVTRAVLASDAALEKLVNNNFGKGYTLKQIRKNIQPPVKNKGGVQKESKYNDNFNSIEFKGRNINNVVYGKVSANSDPTSQINNGFANSELYITQMCESLITKTKKLNEIYIPLEENSKIATYHLYIFAGHNMMGCDDIRLAVNNAKKRLASYAKHYDKLFFNCEDTLFVVDYLTEQIKKYPYVAVSKEK